MQFDLASKNPFLLMGWLKEGGEGMKPSGCNSELTGIYGSVAHLGGMQVASEPVKDRCCSEGLITVAG